MNIVEAGLKGLDTPNWYEGRHRYDKHWVSNPKTTHASCVRFRNKQKQLSKTVPPLFDFVYSYFE